MTRGATSGVTAVQWIGNVDMCRSAEIWRNLCTSNGLVSSTRFVPYLFIHTVTTSSFLRKDVEPEVYITLATVKMFNFSSVRNTHSSHT